MKKSRGVKNRERKSALRRKAERCGVPVMVGVRVKGTRKTIVFTFLVWASVMWCSLAWGTTYYVSSSAGSDANTGTSSGAAWQTIGHVNGQTFAPGDSILFKRGDVWNESLIPPSSGSSGSPITFDAYGTGAAPNLTGYYAVPTTAWVLVTGNAWKAAVPAGYTTINFCLFGSIWGQKVAAVSSNLTAQWDFYLANGFIYVYSVGNPANYYNEPIVPMALSNVPVINVNGKTWLAFQHFLVNWFDQYGVYVQGASDHLVFANMESDSMIPQGTQPLGFYVNESGAGPGDIKIYNSEAHLNYDGFRVDGSATAIAMVNDKAYGNRDGALVDNTGAVTYSYCHFYASSLAVAGSTDVEWTSGTGPVAGAGNVAVDTAPAVQVYQRYPAEVTLTVDDAGMTPGADTYYGSTVLPLADAAGIPVGAAITVGYPLANTLISEFQGWINAGRDVTSHSMSHTYYTNTDAMEIQYTGSGSAATLSIASKTLTITVTGASDSVSYNLAQGQPQGTILGLQQALAATGKFTATFTTPCQGPYGTGCSAYTAAALLAQDLADVSSQNVKSSVYHMQLDVTRLTTDEITLSRNWMTTNLTGLPATPVYVYPGGYETTTMQGITAGVPYTGARGALKEDLGVFDTYADGFNVQNITSFGVNPSWMGLTPASLNQKVQALVWKEKVWGVPWGIFWHYNATTGLGELSGTEVTNLIGDLQASGATIQSNTGLVNWLGAGTQEAGTDGANYYKLPAVSMALDFRPTKNSPVVDAGENLGAAYAIDINGINQNSFGSGWEIGAHVYQGYATYGAGTGAGTFTIGTGSTTTIAAAVTLPQVWVNNHEGDTLFTYELSLPNTWVTVAAPGCTFHAPYWTGTPSSAGLQSAMNDIESCRTATGAGIKLDIPPGLYTSASGLVIPQSSSSLASSFLILNSTQDSSLVDGTTVCSHGIQDNLVSSTDIGLDNPDCAGDAMYYQLGTTITTIPGGAFTLANGVEQNTSAYNDVQFMWTAECSGPSCNAIATCSPLGTSSSSQPPQCGNHANCPGAGCIAPDHWLIEDMEARESAGNTGTSNIVNMQHTNTETSVSNYATHIHFRKVWTHGDWTSLTAGANAVTNAFALGCTACSVVDSQTSQALSPGSEGHSVQFEGSNYKVDHNWFEGSAICTMSAGFVNPPSIFGYVPFQDVEFRRNRCTFPYSWLGQLTVPAGNSNWPGASISRKNGMEFKEGNRIVIDGNIVENVDKSGGQSGTIRTENVRNVASGHGENYQSTFSNITETNNIYRTACEGIEIGGRSASAAGSGGGTSYPIVGYNLNNDLEYNISITNPGCTGVSSLGDSISSGGQSWKGTITENSTGTAATFVATCSVDGGDCPAGPPSIGFEVMDITAGDPVSITGCTAVTTFNVATHSVNGHTVPLGVGPLATAGSAPWSGGFSSAGVTVTYPWVATPNAVDNSGSCTVTNVEGAPQNMLLTHHTLITDSSSALGNGNTPTSGPNFQINHLFRDSILLNSGATNAGWYNSSAGGEGNTTETFNYDISSMSAGYNVWPTRTASKYNDYGNNSSYPLAGGTCGGTGCTPPTTSFFPTGGAAVGFACAGCSTTVPLILNDYHGYELSLTSPYHNAASDSTDIGVSVPAIDAAQTQNLYVCVTGCGTGPYPDSVTLGAPAMFGFTENTTSAGNFPTVNYGMQRFWDSPPLQWPSINTAPGVFNFSNLDANLAQAYSAGVLIGMYTLARTPPWASSNPSDTSCNYVTASSGGGNGECDAPNDVNADGSGSDATWKAWVAAVAGHANSPTYLVNHAHIKYWEIWNEPDNQPFWSGTIAQLARLTEDANCIITGRGVIHQSGNGSATPCTASAIDPTAKIVMAAAHAKGVALTYGQNELYCSASPTGYQLPCPNPANAIASAVDIINFHMKPGNESGNNCPAPTLCTPESAMQMYISNVMGILQPNELAKPLWNGEASYSMNGFTGAYADPDMAASFLPRYYLLSWSLGVSGMAWYTWDALSAEPLAVQTAYQQTYNWLLGATLSAPCTASGTVWSCGMAKAGKQYLVIWDAAQSCSGGSCTTANQTIGTQWIHYQDMTTVSSPTGITGHSVAVGIKPIVLS